MKITKDNFFFLKSNSSHCKLWHILIKLKLEIILEEL